VTEHQEITSEILMNWAGDLENKMITHLVNHLESVLREQIAKEIEAALPDDPSAWGSIQTVRNIAAHIARGNND
jgi:hypothetical protein